MFIINVYEVNNSINLSAKPVIDELPTVVQLIVYTAKQVKIESKLQHLDPSSKNVEGFYTTVISFSEAGTYFYEWYFEFNGIVRLERKPIKIVFCKD